MSVLSREIATYQSHLAVLLDHADEYVLIKGATVVGVFPTRHQALEAGYGRFLDEAFLVRQILPVEAVHALATCFPPG